ncbi:MAG: hypothetical protein KF822_12415, partial [Steroidobacteraceae bacterium]|nr:hypothetical protein [Steroidobacteraceae bacterium]
MADGAEHEDAEREDGGSVAEDAAAAARAAGIELPSAEPPAEDGGDGGGEDGGGETDTLPPLTPADAPRKRGRPRKKRDDSERARKDRRNLRLKQKRQAERALRAAEEAAGIKPTPSAAPAPSAPAAAAAPGAQPATDGAPVGAVLEDGAAMATPEQLATLCGLGVDVVDRTLVPLLLPDSLRGLRPRDLTADEREMLGGVWATALLPYLGGAASAMGVAVITTVQVFALRAMETA